MDFQLVLILMQLVVVIIAIVMGVRTGGVGLGIWGLVGLFVLVFGFHSTPGMPPIDVVFIIMIAVTAASVMEAAGGVSWMVSVAAKLIKGNPKLVIFLAPAAAFLFTVGAGTGNVVFPLLPVIYEVSYEERIRPERPLAMAAVASQVAIMCSPVSAAMAAIVVLLEPLGFGLGKIMMVMWPPAIIAMIISCFIMIKWGKELDDDPEYIRRKKEGLLEDIVAQDLDKLPPTAFSSAMIFLASVCAIVVFGLFPELRPMVGEGEALTRVSVSHTIQIILGVAAALIFLFCRPKAADIPRQPTFPVGMVAAVALFGLAWMANAFVAENNDYIVHGLTRMVEAQPLMFAFALGIVGMLTSSQGAATVAIVPIGVAIGMSAPSIVGMWAAVGACLLIPAQGGYIGAVNIDQTGTTWIGQYVVNHSFTVPVLIYLVVGVALGIPLAYLLA